MISAASGQLIFFAIAFKITSCSFIIRSSDAALNIPRSLNPQNRRRRLNGQITNSFDRTNYLLTTDKSASLALLPGLGVQYAAMWPISLGGTSYRFQLLALLLAIGVCVADCAGLKHLPPSIRHPRANATVKALPVTIRIRLNGEPLSSIKIRLNGSDITSNFTESERIASARIKDGVYVGNNRLSVTGVSFLPVRHRFSYAPPTSAGSSAPAPPDSMPIQTQVQTNNSSGQETNGVEVAQTIYANPGPPTDWQLLLLSRTNLSLVANRHYTITPGQEDNYAALDQLMSDIQPRGALINSCGLPGCLVVLQGPVNNASFSPYPCGSITPHDVAECLAVKSALASIGATETSAFITPGDPSGAGYSFIGIVGRATLSAGVNFERLTCSNSSGCLTLPVPTPEDSNPLFMGGIAPNGVDGVMPTLAGTSDSGTRDIPATPYSPSMTVYNNGAMRGVLVPDNNNKYAFTWGAPPIRFQMGAAADDPNKNIVILQLPAASNMRFPDGQNTLAEESSMLPSGQVGGFHLVILDATTFKTLANATYVDNVTLCPTACPSPDGTTVYALDQLPAALKQFTSRGNLWFLGSIGDLKHDYHFFGVGTKFTYGQDIWDRVAQSVQDLGGTYATFAMLDNPALAGDDYDQYVKDRVPTDDDYNMVGQLWINVSGVPNPYAAEASRAISRQTVLYPVAGNMQGVLKKGHDGLYRAYQHSQYGGVLPQPAVDFGNASYLHRMPWPLTGPNDPMGPKNAYEFISEQLLDCATCDDIRSAYTNTNESPSIWFTALSNLHPPSDCNGPTNPCGFDDSDFATAKAQLLQEFQDLRSLRALQNNMLTAALAEEPNFNSLLTAVADNVLASIPYTTTIQIGANTTDDTLNLIGDVAGFAGLIPDIGSGITAGVQTGLGLYELLSDDGTTAYDPNGLSLMQQAQDFAQIAQLANERANQYSESIASIGAAFNRIVSDWGRMQAAAAPVINNTLQFNVQDLGQYYLPAFNLATRRSLYAALMPLNYYAVHYRYADPGLNYQSYGLRPGWYQLGPFEFPCFAWTGLPNLLATNPQSFGFWEGALIDGPGASVTFSVNGNGNSYPFDAWWDLWFVGQKQSYDAIISQFGNLENATGCPTDNPSYYLPPASFFEATELFTPIGTDANALGFYKPWFLARRSLIKQRAVSTAVDFWKDYGYQHALPRWIRSNWAPDPDNY